MTLRVVLNSFLALTALAFAYILKGVISWFSAFCIMDGSETSFRLNDRYPAYLSKRGDLLAQIGARLVMAQMLFNTRLGIYT